MNKEQLYQVPVPLPTSSYSPVSHKNIIDSVEEQLDKYNMTPETSVYSTSKSGKQLIGYINVKYNENEELGMRIAFRNSYDKSMSVAFVAGSTVWICDNGMISGEIQYVRKHTGSIVSELEGKIISSISKLEEHFELMNIHAEKMKNIHIDKTASAELCGRMFMEHDLINSTQLNIIKRELEKSSFEDFTYPNLWSLYNSTTFSMKQSHPTRFIKDHVNFHKFIESEFSLNT